MKSEKERKVKVAELSREDYMEAGLIVLALMSPWAAHISRFSCDVGLSFVQVWVVEVDIVFGSW